MFITKLTLLTLLCFMSFLISCKSPTRNSLFKDKSKDAIAKNQIENAALNSKISGISDSGVTTQLDLRAMDFVKNLKSREKLCSFFNENWILIYHEDNRCNGSTDGQIDNLKSTQIDSIIRLRVKNDGKGWECNKKKPKSYDLDFDLKKQIKIWDRFEIPDYENQEKNIIYIIGAGESDYLKLHYNDVNLIVKMEYRSEDPG